MPGEDYKKDPNFDESAKEGAKMQLVKLVVWWDCKRYRRFSKALVGWPEPKWVYSVIPLSFTVGHTPFLSTAMNLPEKNWMAHLERAKKEKCYAEVKNADRDPHINEYESKLVVEIGNRVIYDAGGQPLPSTIMPPDIVKSKFNYE